MFHTPSARSATNATGTADIPSFAAHFHTALPRDLQQDGAAMPVDAFLSRYAPSSGPLRLGHWECTDPERPASRLGPQPRNYRAMIAVGDRIGTSIASACGPLGALTAMLHERGVSVEMAAFHQLASEAGTATLIRGTDGVRDEWGVGFSHDATRSELRALLACANRLAQAS